MVRGAGGLYVNVVRNTPLLLILLIFRDAFPELGITPEINNEFNFFFIAATLGLGLYTASFVCEVLRSGVNSIPLGQAEAARSLGMSFGQSMQLIILPQAFRAVVPPMANVYIALAKNTSVAIAIGATEAAFQMRKIMNNNASDRWWVFAGFAAGYMLIVWTIALIAHLIERRWTVAR
jgi:glutamate transport system permease protein